MLVTCITFRNPVLFTKEALTVDHISNGRLELGLGAGYDELEHRMMGIPFPSAAERVARFQEVVEVVDRLLRDGGTTYHGRYYQADEAIMHPAPLQRPRPPLTLGAFGPKMLRVVAEYDDTWVARWAFRGTHEGEALGIAPTGRRVTVTGMILYRISEDGICEYWGSWDRLGLLEQVDTSTRI